MTCFSLVELHVLVHVHKGFVELFPYNIKIFQPQEPAMTEEKEDDGATITFMSAPHSRLD